MQTKIFLDFFKLFERNGCQILYIIQLIDINHKLNFWKSVNNGLACKIATQLYARKCMEEERFYESYFN